MRSSTALRLALAAAVLETAAPAAAQTFLPINDVDGLGLPSVVHVGQTITASAATPILTGFTFHLADAYNGPNLRFDASVFEYAAVFVVGPSLRTLGPFGWSGNVLGYDP